MTTTTTFSFPALPWIFQKRFTEICDTPTMLKFKELSPQTRELSKNRKICKKLRIGDIEHGEECNRDICKCLPGQVLQNVPFADIQNVEIIEEMKIDLARRKTTAEFIQSFSFIASELSLTSFNIEFDALKILLERNLKRFVFLGTIVFNNFDQDFAYLINRLIDINEVVFTMIFDQQETRKQMVASIKKLQKKNGKCFDFWACRYFRFGIFKNYC